MLGECPVYSSIRNTFMGELDDLLGEGDGGVEELSSLHNLNRLLYGVERVHVQLQSFVETT